MSTIDRPGQRVMPPLIAGERLDRATFHERYEAMPPGTWAELVSGVVYMPSPLREEHGETDDQVGYWLAYYRRFTPGLRGGANTTTILGDYGEYQPDRQLRIPFERGGQSRVVDGYVTGPPELVIEVARSSRSFDLGPKKDDYERVGVLEYVFVGLDPDEIRWFVRREGRFVEEPPGPDGLHCSGVFPGLWLDPKALFAGDLNRLTESLEQGLATPEHAAFVARLARAGGAA
jgi:Uma2 family endonuclease